MNNKIITVQNVFHNTIARVNAGKLERAQEYYMMGDGESYRDARRYLHRVGNKLCGCSGCTCSGIDGIRNH